MSMPLQSREKMKKHDQDSKLDQIDLRILNKLQSNARITNQELADAVGLSASPCLQRVKRMEMAGVISGFNATIDLHKVCRHVDVIAAVTLDSHERTIKAMPCVVECTKVAGNFDYLVRFVCPDIGSYQMLSDEMLRLGPKIGNLSSYTVLKVVRRFSGVAIDSLVTT